MRQVATLFAGCSGSVICETIKQQITADATDVYSTSKIWVQREDRRKNMTTIHDIELRHHIESVSIGSQISGSSNATINFRDFFTTNDEECFVR
uniref:Uncharacterized protein n=1 Tax=Onchocerca volvulus TaxID=6282 RepID=A0A8R1XK53_ONCVO